MPSVRCPSCKRLLNVRDEMIGRDARCPLCDAVFPAEPEGGRAVPYQRTPDAPDPSQPWRPAGSRRDDAPVPSYPGPRRDGEGRPAALRAAGNWLFGLSLIALVWGMTCGCGGAVTLLDRGGTRAVDGYILASAFLLQLGFHVVILTAGQSMRTGARNRGLCWTGVVLALTEALFVAGRGLLVLMALEGGPPAELALGFNCVSLMVSGAIFCAGLYAMRVLAGPDGRPKERNPFED